MNKVLEEFSKIGIIPVIALDNVEDAAPLAKSIMRRWSPMCRSYFPYSSC